MLLTLALVAGLAGPDGSPDEGPGGGVRFFEGSFAEALDKAVELDRPIYIDFYADW